MAELPDIDTSEIGWIAYWNALDHGDATVDGIDPTEVLSYTNTTTYTQYDNGVQGEIDHGGHRDDWHFRVKTDGWFVIWLPRIGDFFIQQHTTESDFGGTYSIAHNCLKADAGRSSLPANNASNLINGLYQELSNAGAITFAHADVGVYSYEYPNASTLSIFAARVDRDGTASRSGTLEHTDQTTIHYHTVTAAAFDSDDTTRLDWDGNIVMSAVNGSYEWGSRDVLGQGDMTAGSPTNWDLSVLDVVGFSNQHGAMENVILWS